MRNESLFRQFSSEIESSQFFRKCRRLFESGDFHGVISACATARGAFVNRAEYWEWIGFSNLCLGRYGAAEAALGEACRLDNCTPDVRLALGDIALWRGEQGAAFNYYLAALDAGRLSSDEQVNLEYLARGVGEFRLAALQTEWQLCRNCDNHDYYSRGLMLPRWQGEPLQGRSLFVHWADGFGDNIQHIRFVRNIVDDTGHITVDCPRELYRLFEASLPNIEIILTDDRLPREYDYHTSILALAAFCQLGGEQIPAPPYLFADKSPLPLAARITPCGGEPRIGICWRGSDYDRSRSFDVDCLRQLSSLGCMISLQKGLTDLEKAVLDECCIQHGTTNLSDFFDTANCIAQLDCVVTIDTAVAHLAGAMAKPTVLLLAEPVAPMWACSDVIAKFYPSIISIIKPKNETWHHHLNRVMPTLSRIVPTFQPVFSDVSGICNA
jgi:hypothetical protein